MARSLTYNKANRSRLGKITCKQVLIGKWSKSRNAWRMKLRITNSSGRLIILRTFYVETMRFSAIEKTDEGYVGKVRWDWFKTPGEIAWYLKRGWVEVDSALPVDTALEGMCLPGGKFIVNRPILDWSDLYLNIAGWKE